MLKYLFERRKGCIFLKKSYWLDGVRGSWKITCARCADNNPRDSYVFDVQEGFPVKKKVFECEINTLLEKKHVFDRASIVSWTPEGNGICRCTKGSAGKSLKMLPLIKKHHKSIIKLQIIYYRIIFKKSTSSTFSVLL